VPILSKALTAGAAVMRGLPAWCQPDYRHNGGKIQGFAAVLLRWFPMAPPATQLASREFGGAAPTRPAVGCPAGWCRSVEQSDSVTAPFSPFPTLRHFDL